MNRWLAIKLSTIVFKTRAEVITPTLPPSLKKKEKKKTCPKMTSFFLKGLLEDWDNNITY